MVFNQSQIRQELFEYINKNVHGSKTIADNTLLFREGVIDSMGFILLIDFLEDKFSVKANDEDLIEENFESVNAIEQFIIRKNFPKK